MQVETTAIHGTYDELRDAAEDIAKILSAKVSNVLDLSPAAERWLIDQLDEIELLLRSQLGSDRGGDRGPGPAAILAFAAAGNGSVA